MKKKNSKWAKLTKVPLLFVVCFTCDIKMCKILTCCSLFFCFMTNFYLSTTHIHTHSYVGQSNNVNEIFPPITNLLDSDDDNDDRSDASRTPDEGITSDDELQFGALE